MRKKSFVLLFVICSSVVFGQDSLYVRKWSKPIKKTIYKKNSFLTVEYTEFHTDSSKTLKNVTLEGKLRKVTDNSLTIAIRTEKIEMDFENGKSTEIQNQYSLENRNYRYGYDYEEELRTVSFRKITQLYSNTEKRGYEFGSALMGCSIFTALLVAPLTSINYKTGKFNQKQYYTVAGFSLVGVAVAIPIMALTQSSKYFNIKSRKPDEDDNYYYFLDNK